MNKNVRNTIWYFLPFFARNLIPLLSLPFFTRFLSPEDYGSLALSMVYAVFSVGVLNFGLITIFERNYFEQKNYKEKLSLMWTCLLFVALNLSFGFVLTLNYEPILNFYLFNKNLPTFLTALAFGHIGLKSLLQFFYIHYRNAQKANIYALFSLLEAVLCVSLSVLFVFSKKGILGFVLGQILGVFILFSVLAMVALLRGDISFKFSLLKRNLVFSLPLTPRVFFGVINTQFDRYMLGFFGNNGGVGIFDIGQKIANIGFLFSTVLQQVFAPKVFQTYIDQPEQFAKKIGSYLAPFFYVTTFFSFLLGLFSQEILFVLTTPLFYDAYPIILILNMLYTTYFFGKQPQLLLAKKVKLISLLSFLSVFTNILISIPLIRIYGIMGAALGTFSSGMLSSLCSFYFAQKYAKIEYDKQIYFVFCLFQVIMLLLLVIWYFKLNYFISLTVKFCFLLGFSLYIFKNQLIDFSAVKGFMKI